MALLLGNRFSLFFIFLFITTCLFAEHEGELGYCVLGDEMIMSRDGFYLRPNEEYREAWFLFSNNMTGKVGFCREHFENLSEKDFPDIITGIENGWKREFRMNNWTIEKIDKYKQDFFNLIIIRRLNDEEISANN